MKADLILIHPPSLYDFRKTRRHYGPISDVVPSTPVFDMYPAGFISLTSYLSAQGYRVGVLNLAARMLMSRRFDAEKAIAKARARVYGIDLHWLVHAQGAIEVARLVKKYHPDAPVVLGGFSSTIYYREILARYPWIDYVLLGDTTEEPYRMLLGYLIENRGSPDKIPNLAWRTGQGNIATTGLKWVPEDLDPYAIEYGEAFCQAVRSGDPLSFIPFAGFLREPIGAVFPYRGCPYNCATCGGSFHTYCKYLGRCRFGRKKPSVVAGEVESITDYMKIPVFVVNDLQVLGSRWAEEFVKELRERGIDVTLFYEFFKPPTREFLEILRKSPGDVILQISPESQDENVRKAFGRLYGNRELEEFVSNALDLGFKRLDLYFMVGLPLQTFETAAALPSYIDGLYRRLPRRDRPRLDAFVAPLAPFVDPGSRAFDNPGKYGYRLRARTLEEHRRLIEEAPTWKEMLNYETIYMSREQIAEATYRSAEGLVKVKASHGVIPEEEARRTLERMRLAREAADEDLLYVKETVPKGDLYPTAKLVKCLTPRALKPGLLVALVKALFSRL